MLQDTGLRSVISYWLVISFAVFLSAGCGNREGGPTAGNAPQSSASPSAKKYTIGVSLLKTDDPWRAQMKADLEAAATDHPEIGLVFRDAKDAAERQQADVEQFLADRVAMLIVCPKDAETLAASIGKIFDAGIPVIVVDRAIVGDKYTCFIRPDNQQIGAAAGKWLADKLGGKGKIVAIKGPVDAIAIQQRYDAFRAMLRDPGYRFVYEGCLDPPRVDAKALMKEALERVEQIDAVFACTDEAAEAAYETAKAQGREKGIIFFGIGGMPADGLKYVSEGGVAATFLHPTCGREAIDAAVRILAGQKVPKSISLGTRVYTKDNIAQGGEPIDAIR